MIDGPDEKKRRTLDFAKRLINTRSDRGMSQIDLANRASGYLPPTRSFSRASISRYEAGENLPGSATLAALAKALSVEPDDLLPRRIAATPRSPMLMEEDASGLIKISIDTRVEPETAMKIFALLQRRPQTET